MENNTPREMIKKQRPKDDYIHFRIPLGRGKQIRNQTANKWKIFQNRKVRICSNRLAIRSNRFIEPGQFLNPVSLNK